METRILNDSRKQKVFIYDDEFGRLNVYDFCVYLALKRVANNSTMTAQISAEKLSSITGLSLSTVKRSIKSLREKNVVRKKSGTHDNTANIYVINQNPELWKT